MSADTLCWTDIPVTNLDRAVKFYSAVLGQEVRKMSEGEFEYVRAIIVDSEGNRIALHTSAK